MIRQLRVLFIFPIIWFCIYLSIIDFTFTIIFTIEMIFKMFAFGLYGRFKDLKENNLQYKGYFNDGFNVIDFIVVVAGILSVIIPNVSSIRILRVFKPLRSATQLRGTLS